MKRRMLFIDRHTSGATLLREIPCRLASTVWQKNTNRELHPSLSLVQ